MSNILSLNEAFNILGGTEFLTRALKMTNPVDAKQFISFRFKGSSAANAVRLELVNDRLKVTLYKVGRKSLTEVASETFADRNPRVFFTRVTGIEFESNFETKHDDDCFCDDCAAALLGGF